MKRFFAIGALYVAFLGVLMTPKGADAQTDIKHVIIMIADGWGINQINATNYWQGTGDQPYQSFPYPFYMSSYSQTGVEAAAPDPAYDASEAWTDFNYMLLRPTDSAASATAMSTGAKTYDGRINIDPNGVALFTITERARELGKSVGVVTSVTWSHATPACYVAHNISRENYQVIAQEMLASDIDVIMGCGNPNFNNDNEPVTPSIPDDWEYVGGEAQWNDLVEGNTAWTLIQSQAEFQALVTDPNPPARICGTAQCRRTLQQERTTVSGEEANGTALPYSAPLNDVPTLEEMAQGALNVLEDNPLGFFLMIEGGAVDWAGHDNQMGRMIEEMSDFNNTVQAVISWVETNSNWDETLLIVTGDHETGYLWGPDSSAPATFNEIVDNGAGNLPGGWFHSGYHSNSLIPIYIKGAGGNSLAVFADETDSVRGPYLDNTEIAAVIFDHYDVVLSAEAGGYGAFNALHPNSPNPFNPTTTISYDVKQTGHITLRIYDLLGREITELVHGVIPAGSHSITWDASGLPSGVYFYRINAANFTASRKLLLVK